MVCSSLCFIKEADWLEHAARGDTSTRRLPVYEPLGFPSTNTATPTLPSGVIVTRNVSIAVCSDPMFTADCWSSSGEVGSDRGARSLARQAAWPPNGSPFTWKLRLIAFRVPPPEDMRHLAATN